MEEQKLVIVHLSDLHLKEGDSWRHDFILANLVDDLGKRLQGFPRDNLYAVISGDLSFDGTKGQFDMAKLFIQDLKKSLGFKEVIVCPGNHDLHRTTIKKDKDLMALFARMFGNHQHDSDTDPTWKDIESAEKALTDLYEDPKERARFGRGMFGYNNLLDEIGQNHSEYLFSTVSKKFGRTSVNFICLNSAFLFRDKKLDEDYGYIGQKQIERAYVQGLSNIGQECDEAFNIFVFHHPFSKLVPDIHKRNENIIKKLADLVLTGHIHELEISMDLTSIVDQPSGPSDAFRRRKYPIISSSRCVFDEETHPFTRPGYSIFAFPSESGKIGHDPTIYEIDYADGIWQGRRENNPFTIDMHAWECLRKLRSRFGYQDYYETMADSPHSPLRILNNRHMKKFEFMGTFGDKWVGNSYGAHRLKLEAFLKRNKNNSVKFLLLNPKGKGAKQLESERDKLKKFPRAEHERLLKAFPNYAVRLYDPFPKYRLTFIDDRKVGVLLHAIDKHEYEQQKNEFNLPLMEFAKSDGSNTLYNFFRDYYDASWDKAKEMREVFSHS